MWWIWTLYDFVGPSICNQFKNLSVDHVIEVLEQDLRHGQCQSSALSSFSSNWWLYQPQGCKRQSVSCDQYRCELPIATVPGKLSGHWEGHVLSEINWNSEVSWRMGLWSWHLIHKFHNNNPFKSFQCVCATGLRFGWPSTLCIEQSVQASRRGDGCSMLFYQESVAKTDQNSLPLTKDHQLQLQSWANGFTMRPIELQLDGGSGLADFGHLDGHIPRRAKRF